MKYKQYVFNYIDRKGIIWNNHGEGLTPENPAENVGTIEEILIKTELVKDKTYWIKLGIQGPPGLEFVINNIPFILGNSGIYEVDNYEINSFQINYTPENKNIIIDFGYQEVPQL